MLEEKNDSLQNADGSLESTFSEVQHSEDSSDAFEKKDASVITTDLESAYIATSEARDDTSEISLETLVGIEIAETHETESTSSEVVVPEITVAAIPVLEYLKIDDSIPNLENEASIDPVIDAITTINAAESEDTLQQNDIPMLDYETLSMDDLVLELEKLVSSEKVMAVKDHVEEVKKSFLSKYNQLIEEKKEAFFIDNPDTTEDFHYHFPLKSKLDHLYSQYRERKNSHFKSLQTNLQANLETRLAVVEELKNLINPQENIKDTLKQFNELRDRWKNAGSIPKDKYNHVWNNYHFHIENFYDYLHLDREARDIDFKHNLELKLKIIVRVEELVHEEDINKSFRELQDLHKIWKEDIGPVSKENRDVVWNRFSELTKLMHDKREVLFEQLRGVELENLAVKNDIIANLTVLSEEKVNSHAAWLNQVQKVEVLRNEFFEVGKVPTEMNESTWTAFKNAVRNFNVLKNSFYKDIKKDQNDNLSRKQALVTKAKELQLSTDFILTTPAMKKIQEEWKEVGHVPRKYSDKLWTEFRAACNAYFEKIKNQKTEENSEEVAAFENKKEYLETLRVFEMSGDHKTDLDAIKLHIESWKGFGKVPFTRRHIEGKFNKILDTLFEKLTLSKKETEIMRFSNRMANLSESNDTRKLDNEKIFLVRKIEEVQNEIFQLENNIQFFTNTRNAKKENSIVLEVRKNIAIQKESLDVLKEKLKQLRDIKQE